MRENVITGLYLSRIEDDDAESRYERPHDVIQQYSLRRAITDEDADGRERCKMQEIPVTLLTFAEAFDVYHSHFDYFCVDYGRRQSRCSIWPYGASSAMPRANIFPHGLVRFRTRGHASGPASYSNVPAFHFQRPLFIKHHSLPFRLLFLHIIFRL